MIVWVAAGANPVGPRRPCCLMGVLGGPHQALRGNGRPECTQATGGWSPRKQKWPEPVLVEGRAQSTHRSRFPRILCLEPPRAGWPHGHSRRPGRPRQEMGPLRAALFGLSAHWSFRISHPTHSHLLVLLQGDAGLSSILGLDKKQLVPLNVFKDALGKDTRQAVVWVGRRWIKDTGVLATLNSALDVHLGL